MRASLNLKTVPRLLRSPAYIWAGECDTVPYGMLRLYRGSSVSRFFFRMRCLCGAAGDYGFSAASASSIVLSILLTVTTRYC
eukprot:6178614-Pleurochrysis_carterae.AAC.4